MKKNVSILEEKEKNIFVVCKDVVKMNVKCQRFVITFYDD